jgi:hypothetical protein
MYKIEIEWKEYYYETLEEAEKVAGRMYEVTGNRHAISEVKQDEMKKYKKYIFRVEQWSDIVIEANSEEEAWDIMGEEDLSELKPEQMEWNIVDVIDTEESDEQI